MKTFLFTICSLLVLNCAVGTAQVKQGKVTFIADFTGVYDKSLKKGNVRLANLMRGINEVSKDIKLELTFNESESFFSKGKSMPLDHDTETYNSALELCLDGDYYTNLKSKQLLKTVKEDKTYLISLSPLKAEDWVLTKESKKIGKYTCYKATSAKSISGPNGPIKIQLSAWYAPEIPVRFGPKHYSNLPGLILEVQEGEVVYRCVGITLNQPAKVAIIAPSKGTAVTEAAFDKIIEKRIAQFNAADKS